MRRALPCSPTKPQGLRQKRKADSLFSIPWLYTTYTRHAA